MPSLLELQWIGAALASVVALISISKAAPAVIAGIRRWTWGPVVDHFRGVHAMIGDVGLMRGEISSIKQRVDAELGHNGGSSLKDQVTKISARQAAIFDSMQRPAFQASADGTFVTVNRAFETLTGYPARDLFGMGWVNLLHQGDADAFMVAWHHAIDDGRIMRRECRMVKANGEEITVCADTIPVKVGTQVLEWQGTLEAA